MLSLHECRFCCGVGLRTRDRCMVVDQGTTADVRPPGQLETFLWTIVVWGKLSLRPVRSAPDRLSKHFSASTIYIQYFFTVVFHFTITRKHFRILHHVRRSQPQSLSRLLHCAGTSCKCHDDLLNQQILTEPRTSSRKAAQTANLTFNYRIVLRLSVIAPQQFSILSSRWARRRIPGWLSGKD